MVLLFTEAKFVLPWAQKNARGKKMHIFSMVSEKVLLGIISKTNSSSKKEYLFETSVWYLGLI